MLAGRCLNNPVPEVLDSGTSAVIEQFVLARAMLFSYFSKTLRVYLEKAQFLGGKTIEQHR